MNSYKTNNNYTHLKELLLQGKKIVCFVTYEDIIDDIAIAKYVWGGKYSKFTVGVRGNTFFDAFISDELKDIPFERYCEIYKLRYIEPNS